MTVQGLQPAAHEDVEVVLHDSRADATHGNGPFGNTVKVNQVGPPAPQVGCRPDQKLETPHWAGGLAAHRAQFKAPELLHYIVLAGGVDGDLVAELCLPQCRFYNSSLGRTSEPVQRMDFRGTDVRNLERPHARTLGKWGLPRSMPTRLVAAPAAMFAGSAARERRTQVPRSMVSRYNSRWR